MSHRGVRARAAGPWQALRPGRGQGGVISFAAIVIVVKPCGRETGQQGETQAKTQGEQEIGGKDRTRLNVFKVTGGN